MIPIQWSVFRTAFLLLSVGFLISACGDDPCSQVDLATNPQIPATTFVSGGIPVDSSCVPSLVVETNPKDLLSEEEQQNIKDQFALTNDSSGD